MTKKDKEAIEIGKKLLIKNYALSFVNTTSDIENFNKILKKENKIFKIETAKSIKNLKSIINTGSKFLIDRRLIQRNWNRKYTIYSEKNFKIS